MERYTRINNIFGWLAFLISATVYLLTIEPTASFWDCGEFIATAYKMEVGHPPGAPFFLLLGRIFTLFAGDNLEMVPIMVNVLSALLSAGTILFLFWTITHLAKKMVVGKEEITIAQIISIMGAGLVGALAYTFSDSFWFSAVEGEVYATSAFFTAFVFWAIFKWEGRSEERHASRWLILIAYFMGLSIGVHLLNLLAIPALSFVFYFKKYKPTTKGIIYTTLISFLILVVIQYGIIPGTVSLASKFELLFVNSLGLPFNSGVLFYAILTVAAIVFGLYYTHKKTMPLLNTAILCVAFILIGYTSYAQIVIRSSANTPMDENNPENVFSLLAYLNREQYGDRPLIYGQYYNARAIDQEEGSRTYIKGETKYIAGDKKVTPIYEPARTTLLPRMYSSQANHISAYKEWSGVKGDQTPTMANNLKFLFSYQLGHMYWRYFMWNFVGRQNDLQGHGGITKGNWISGIKFIDEMRLGPQDKLPDSMTWNKGMNTFYFLPFILGLIGMFYQFKKNNKDAFIVLLMFFMTGIAIVLYLNGPPFQPRERDYAYAGSFYAFAIWIGIGVLAAIEFLRKYTSPTVAASVATVVCLLAVPTVMAKEGWNDHDRSHRKTSRDFAYNYLNSCAPNAIIFTNGDNDTFPLWYAQEVEGIRTDIRVVNLSLLNTDWYVDQMKRRAYESAPLPISMTSDQYVQGTRDYVPYYDRQLKDPVNLKDLMGFITSDKDEAKVSTQGGGKMNYFPSKILRLPVDSAKVVSNGTVQPQDADQIVSEIIFSVDRQYLMKADIVILDLLANFNWERPIYFAVTVSTESFLNLQDYFQLEGLAYRLVPVKSTSRQDGQPGRVQNDIMYDNMMNKFMWGNMKDERVYLDQNNLNMTSNLRNNFSRLAENLLTSGRRDSAEKVLDKCMEEMPDKTVPLNIFAIRLAELYYYVDMTTPDGLLVSNPELANMPKTKATEKGNIIVKRLAEIYENDLNYYFSLKGSPYIKFVDRDMNQAMAVIQELIRISKMANQQKLTKELEDKFNALQARYVTTGRS